MRGVVKSLKHCFPNRHVIWKERQQYIMKALFIRLSLALSLGRYIWVYQRSRTVFEYHFCLMWQCIRQFKANINSRCWYIYVYRRPSYARKNNVIGYTQFLFFFYVKENKINAIFRNISGRSWSLKRCG